MGDEEHTQDHALCCNTTALISSTNIDFKKHGGCANARPATFLGRAERGQSQGDTKRHLPIV